MPRLRHPICACKEPPSRKRLWTSDNHLRQPSNRRSIPTRRGCTSLGCGSLHPPRQMGSPSFKVLSAKDKIAPQTHTASLIFDDTGLVRTALLAEKADKMEEKDLVRYSCEPQRIFARCFGRQLRRKIRFDMKYAPCLGEY